MAVTYLSPVDELDLPGYFVRQNSQDQILGSRQRVNVLVVMKCDVL